MAPLRSSRLPDVGEGIAEAEIVAWHVTVGDMVAEDEPLVDVMTDKATVELPAPADGKVVAIHGEVGEKRAVGSELVVLEVEGEQVEAEQVEARPHPAAADAASTLSRTATKAASAAPAVRKRAADLGIAPSGAVSGKGPGGRIIHADLDSHIARSAPPAAPGHDPDVEAVPIVGLRRAIAAHLEELHRRIPHFSYIEEVDVGAVEGLRAYLNAEHKERPHLTLLPFLIRATVRAIAAHPQVNARFDDETGVLNRYRAVHLGVATQTEAQMDRAIAVGTPGLVIEAAWHLGCAAIAADPCRLSGTAAVCSALSDPRAALGTDIDLLDIGEMRMSASILKNRRRSPDTDQEEDLNVGSCPGAAGAEHAEVWL